LIDNYAPARTTPSRRPGGRPATEVSRACEAYSAFTAAVLERADTPLVQFLRGYAIENGYGMGSSQEPTATACSRMLRELVELGLDPSLPDGGWSRAAMLLDLGPVGSIPPPRPSDPVNLVPTDRYDPRPERVREPLVLRPDFGYVLPRPRPLGLREVGPDRPIVAYFVPDDVTLGLVAAPEGADGFCNEGRLLSGLDAYRAFATMRELTRRLGPPRLILSGRDCALAETAAELSAATFDDPAYIEFDELAPADFDRRLDGLDLSEAERSLARAAVGGLVAALDFEAPGAWHALVTTPDIVEAMIGVRTEGGSVAVVDALTGVEIARFRMRHGSEDQ
jgi:hypothetical protein